MTDVTNGTFVPEFKRCNSCAQDKPATAEFFATRPNTRYKDGLQSQCRACISLKQRERNARGRYWKKTNDARARERADRRAAKPVLTVQERFFAKVMPEPMSGCWLWLGPWNREGYGYFSSGGKNQERAHRFSWRMHKGEIPEGMHACHRCDNPSCVRPDHLFLGTPRDNVEDCVRKGRKKVRKGDEHSSSKLTAENVRLIRSFPRESSSFARQFNVSKRTIVNVIRRETWKSVK